MSPNVPQPPVEFKLPPIGGCWFRWAEIGKCFWPGRGQRAHKVDPVLASIRPLGGVYLIAWSKDTPATASPPDPAVKYVGETGEFRGRVGQFGTSAGFWGDRDKGHSAGWRWPLGQTECLWIAFFDVGNDLLPHLATGLRHWMEGLAQEEYRVAHGTLPPLNLVENGVISFDPVLGT